jgi:hypothetical protein
MPLRRATVNLWSGLDSGARRRGTKHDEHDARVYVFDGLANGRHFGVVGGIFGRQNVAAIVGVLGVWMVWHRKASSTFLYAQNN